jgi:hypothetical protein
MQVKTVQQAEAITRLKNVQRVQRLLEVAKGSSWLHGRMLFLALLAFAAPLFAMLGRDAPPAAAGLLMTAATLAVAIVERLGKRIDAVVELLELHGRLHGPEHVVTASSAADEGARP